MCPVSSSTDCNLPLKLIGDYWTLRIISALKRSELRFCELQRATDNLNPVTLTTRLKKLEDAGLVHRHEDPNNKLSVSYGLTDLGKDALPVIKAIEKFSTKLAVA